MKTNNDNTDLYSKEFVTTCLKDAVPVFNKSSIRFTLLENGKAETCLPLNNDTTNQHGTHQATLMALAADYTGGAAIASLINSVPMAGVHPVYGNDSQCMWLVAFNLNYLSPSSTDLYVSCEVPIEQNESICKKFWDGQANFITLEILMKNDLNDLVAEGKFIYYLRHSSYMAPQQPGKNAGVMFEHMIKSSARLVANIRSREKELYVDPYSKQASGKHGELLGNRFLDLMPQLQTMISARTKHLDDCLENAITNGVEQVVMLGSGLDFRPYRFAEKYKSVKYFELDLPEMLKERQRVIETFVGLPLVDREQIPINLDFASPVDILRQTDFLFDKPVFVIYEGCSMYFKHEQADRIFSVISDLLSFDKKSLLWTDVVSEEAVNGKDLNVIPFLEGMAKMGEPFVWGCDNNETYFSQYDLNIVRCDKSNFYSNDIEERIFEHYSFLLLNRNNNIKNLLTVRQL